MFSPGASMSGFTMPARVGAGLGPRLRMKGRWTGFEAELRAVKQWRSRAVPEPSAMGGRRHLHQTHGVVRSNTYSD
jgi:hypothetical protein